MAKKTTNEEEANTWVPVMEAIAKAKTQTQLAKLCKVHRSTVNKWFVRDMRIPIEQVPIVSEATGIPAWKLRPDKPKLFPHPPIQEKEKKDDSSQSLHGTDKESNI